MQLSTIVSTASCLQTSPVHCAALLRSVRGAPGARRVRAASRPRRICGDEQEDHTSKKSRVDLCCCAANPNSVLLDPVLSASKGDQNGTSKLPGMLHFVFAALQSLQFSEALRPQHVLPSQWIQLSCHSVSSCPAYLSGARMVGDFPLFSAEHSTRYIQIRPDAVIKFTLGPWCTKQTVSSELMSLHVQTTFRFVSLDVPFYCGIGYSWQGECFIHQRRLFQ